MSNFLGSYLSGSNLLGCNLFACQVLGASVRGRTFRSNVVCHVLLQANTDPWAIGIHGRHERLAQTSGATVRVQCLGSAARDPLLVQLSIKLFGGPAVQSHRCGPLFGRAIQFSVLVQTSLDTTSTSVSTAAMRGAHRERRRKRSVLEIDACAKPLFNTLARPSGLSTVRRGLRMDGAAILDSIETTQRNARSKRLDRTAVKDYHRE